MSDAMPPILVDTHAHLDQEDFNAHRAEVIARANAAGVRQIVAIGCTAASSEAVVQLAAEYDGVFAAVGLQPNYCGDVQDGDWQRIVELSRREKVIAIGETGLDRYWDHAPFDVQQDYFDRHLRLAQELDLPVVIHTRESDADVVQTLREAVRRGPVRGIMHSFTGSAETAAECVALGLHISFAGMVTFKKSDALRAVAATIPDERILVETDSPYLSPQPLRGKRNEPANVVHTARCLAEVRGVELERFAALTTENARRLFRLPELG
jgi:TatD DNase family protein